MKVWRSPSIVIWLILVLVSIVVVVRAPYTADMSAFLPRKPDARQQVLMEQLSEGVASRSLIIAIDHANTVVDKDLLSDLSVQLGRALVESGRFSLVANGQNSQAGKDQELLFNQRYLLSPAMNEQRMQPAGLRAAVKDSLLEVASSTGLMTKNLLERDPTGESLQVLLQVLPQTSLSTHRGVWMNRSQTRAMLLVQTVAPGSDLDGQEQAHQILQQAWTQVGQAAGPQAATARMQFSGAGVFAVASRESIRSEAAQFSSIGMLLVLGLLWLIYRSVTALALGIIPVATGALAGIASVALGFGVVHAMTLGFGITLIGEAVDYAIYLFVHHSQARASGGPDGLADWNARFSDYFWPTIRLGVLTSVAGFCTLLFSGFLGLAQLGLFTVVGIVIAALVTRYVLPKLLPEHFAIHKPKKLGQFLQTAVGLLTRWRWLAIAVVVASSAYLLHQGKEVWRAQLGSLSPASPELQQRDEQLRSELGAPDAGVLVVIKAGALEQVLQISEAASSQLNPLVTQGVLGGYEAASRYLPSQQLQRLRQQSLPEPEALRTRMGEALAGLPLQPGKLEPFFADVERARQSPLLGLNDLSGTSLKLGIDSLVQEKNGQWTGLILLRAPLDESGRALDVDLAKLKGLNSLVMPADAQLHVLPIRQEADRIYQDYLGEALILTGIGMLIIAAMLALALRSVGRWWQVVMPLVATVIVVAALVSLIHGGLNLLHLVGLLLVVAVGSNYALFFDQNGQSQSTQSTQAMLCSLLFANLTTVTGFGLLAFSSVPVMNAIGLTVGLGALLALLLSAVFSRP
jgi:predicted exporter